MKLPYSGPRTACSCHCPQISAWLKARVSNILPDALLEVTASYLCSPVALYVSHRERERANYWEGQSKWAEDDYDTREGFVPTVLDRQFPHQLAEKCFEVYTDATFLPVVFPGTPWKRFPPGERPSLETSKTSKTSKTSDYFVLSSLPPEPDHRGFYCMLFFHFQSQENSAGFDLIFQKRDPGDEGRVMHNSWGRSEHTFWARSLLPVWECMACTTPNQNSQHRCLACDWARDLEEVLQNQSQSQHRKQALLKVIEDHKPNRKRKSAFPC